MKTKAIAASAIIALFLAGAVVTTFARSELTSPAINMSPTDSGPDGGDGQNQQTTTQQSGEDQQTTTQQTTTQQTGDGGGSDDGDNNQLQGISTGLVVGQIITFSNLGGDFVRLNGSTTGLASGSLTVKVTEVLGTGVTLSLVSGHISFANTTSTITGGSLVLDNDGESGVGTGTFGITAFIIHVEGVQVGPLSNAGAFAFDFRHGTSEFLVSLETQGIQEVTSGD